MEEAKTVSAGKEIPAFSDEDQILIRGISKSYGVVHALKDVSFGIRKGEIRTFLGENGAGKSTLVKIIMGEEHPDSGEIVIEGTPLKEYSPEHSQKTGISMVHQELAVFENMTVAENIFPNSVFRRGVMVNNKELERRAAESLALFNLDLRPDQKMDTLTLAQQQMVEILRCISNNQKIILLDEPTSGLNNEEADRLMQVTKDLASRGITIIYISHRINEVMEISDNITVMRDGRYICTFRNDENLKEDDLVARMVGHDLSAGLYSKKAFTDASENEVIFEVKDLSKKGALSHVSFDLHQGEVIGFFGLEGSGSNTLSRMIYGLEGKDTGELVLFGKKITKITPAVLIREKMMYLNNNRKTAGLLLNSSANDNMLVPVMDEMTRGIIIQKKKSYEHTAKFIRMFSIAIPSIFQKPKNLSGGNQQKLMLSACLGTEPRLLVVNEPTRGIDVGAKAEIHRFLLQCSEEGIGLIIFSSELPELMSLCDRIFVMKNKALAGILSGDEIAEEAVVALAAGGK